MKTYADTVTAAHELQTHFALRATSEERNALQVVRIIHQDGTLYKQTTDCLSTVPRYHVAKNGGKWEYSTAAECYAALCQI